MQKAIVRLKSPRNFIRFALSITVGTLIVGLSGCGSKAVTLFARQKPVKVSLIQLAEQTPEWAAVNQLDQANALVGAPVSDVDKAFFAPGAEMSAGPSAIVASGSAVRSKDEAARLQIEADRAVESVRVRIERNQDRLIKIAEDQGNRRVAEGVAEARRQAIQEYLSKIPQLMAEGAAQRTNLKVQIGALKVNADPKNAITAPDDYWGHLLAAREAALASLKQPQTDAEKLAQEQIAGSVADARAKLEAASAAEIAAYRSTLDDRRKAVIARQIESLGKEQSELLSISNELDQELKQPVVVSQDLLDVRSKTEGGEKMKDDADMRLSSGNDAAKSRLAEQRARLVSQILDVTQRKAMIAAQSLNLKIVDWSSAKPDPAAMKDILARMRLSSSVG